MRALALLHNQLGSLSRAKQILRTTVDVHCVSDFTWHSEVSDGEFDVLFRVLGEAGGHTRT